MEYLQWVNDFKNVSDTIRKIVEKEYKKEISEGEPARIIVTTGENNEEYVRILQHFDFPKYSRYDLDVYDEHGDAISVYIPKKEKEK